MPPFAILRFLLPNLLTISRLALGVAFPWIPDVWRLATVLFVAISDSLDGWLSRRFGGESTFGQIMDPMADKAFVLIAAGTLVVEQTLLVWQLLAVAARDLTVLAITGWKLLRRPQTVGKMKPRVLGKLTTFFQFVFLVWVVTYDSPQWALLLTTAALSGVAAVDYLQHYARQGEEEP